VPCDGADQDSEGGMNSTTIAATAWLIKFAPERLAAWLARHPNAAELEKVAREWVDRGWKL
jgi:hypothetical protein